MPKVSVIIPIYNVEPYLRQALDSVINQTLKDIEIICVDDCSTDRCPEILKEYASKDDRIVFLEQEVNQGSGPARNRALDIAKGEVVMFLDPDDWYELNACEKAYNQIIKNNNDYLYMNYCFYKETDNGWRFKSGDDHLECLFAKADCPDIKLWELKNNFWHNVNTVCRAYKRDFIEKYNIRYDKLRLCQDVPFFAKCIANAQSVSVILDELYVLRDRAGSSNKTAKNYEGTIISRRMAYDIIKNSSHSKDLTIPCLCYMLTVLAHFNRLTKIDEKIEKEFYNKIRKFFLFLDKREDMEIIKDHSPRYQAYREIIRTPYYLYKLKQFYQALQNTRFKEFFNVEIVQEKKKYRRIITLFGISFKMKIKNVEPEINEELIKNRIRTKIKNRIVTKIKNNQPINVIFLSNEISKSSHSDLYNKFAQSKYFKPKVVVYPATNIHKSQENIQSYLKSLYDFYKNQGNSVECVYNQEKCFYRDLGRYCPDIIIYLQNSKIPVKYRMINTSKYAFAFLAESERIFENIEKNIGEKVFNE